MSFAMISENQVAQVILEQGSSHKGIEYANTLYEHVASLSEEHRLKAYLLSNEILGMGMAVCITISSQGYSVWKSLNPIFSN